MPPGSSGSTGMGRYGPRHTTSRPSVADRISADYGSRGGRASWCGLRLFGERRKGGQHPVAGVTGLVEALMPAKHHLASVGVGGFGDRRRELASTLNQLGVSRICSLGTMQAPPLSWCHDGRGVLLPLARLSGSRLTRASRASASASIILPASPSRER